MPQVAAPALTLVLVFMFFLLLIKVLNVCGHLDRSTRSTNSPGASRHQTIERYLHSKAMLTGSARWMFDGRDRQATILSDSKANALDSLSLPLEFSTGCVGAVEVYSLVP